MGKYNLADFTGYDDDPRSYLIEPFNYGEYQAASNGHIILFEPFDGKERPPTMLKQDNIKSIFDKIQSGEYVDIPKLYFPEKLVCHDCKGTGRLTRLACEECDATGFVEWSTDFNDYEANCKSCDGDGYEASVSKYGSRCSTCNATGHTYTTKRYGHPIAILGKHINANYAELLCGVEGTKIAQVGDMIAFKNGNQFGAIMMMRV